MSNLQFFRWQITDTFSTPERSLVCVVPTLQIARQALAFWRKERLALARANAIGKKADLRKRAGLWRANTRRWKYDHAHMTAFCRMVDYCRKHGFDACLYGGEPHDVDPYYEDFFTDLHLAVRDVRLAEDKSITL